MKAARLTVATAAVAVGLGAMLVPDQVAGRPEDVRVLVVGLALIACGLVLPAGDRARLCGALLVAAGFAWFLPSFDVTGQAFADRVIASTSLLHIALVVSAVVLVPTAAIRAPSLVAALVPAYVAAVCAAVGGYRTALIAAGLALTVVVVATSAGLRTNRTRAGLAFVTAGLLLGLELALSNVIRLASDSPPERMLALTHEVALVVVAALVLAAVAGERVVDAVDLKAGGAEALEPTVARALDDPNLTVRFPDGEGGWLDPLGRPRGALSLPTREIRVAGDVVSVLGTRSPVPTSLEGPLRDVLRLGRDNAQLRRAVTRQLDELAVSRRRLLEAGDTERQALERQLRNGALAYLNEICDRLDAVPSLPLVRERAWLTRTELEHVGNGLDPLARGTSLVDALRAVTEHTTNAVGLSIDEKGLDDGTRRVLWYACAEGLANAWKHAPGSTVMITVVVEEGAAVLTVVDDGPGGADPGGSGLVGLADRAAALGGVLEISDGASGGTRLRFTLPARAGTHRPGVGSWTCRDAASWVAA